MIQWTLDNDDVEYDAQCIRSTDQGIEVGGCNFVGQWTFKNNGTTAWPRDIYFNRLRGDDVEFKVIGFNLREEGPFNTENLTVTVNFKLPLNPGCYFVTFGLTYGFDDGFQVGKEVTINLESKESLYDTLSDGQFSLDRFFEIAVADTDAAQKNQLTNINNPYDQIMSEQATAAAEAVEEERKSTPYEQLLNRLSQVEIKTANKNNQYSELLEEGRLLTEDEDEYVEKLDLSNDSWLMNNADEEDLNTDTPVPNMSATGCNFVEGLDLYTARVDFKD